MSERFTVATANTQFGRAIHDLAWVESLNGVDALLLQEVKMHEDEFAEQISQHTHLSAGHFDEEFGLAIAINAAKHTIQEQRTEVLQERSEVGRRVMQGGHLMDTAAFRLRARGLLAMTLKTPEERQITVATTHPTIPVKIKSRANQIRRIPGKLRDIEGPLVLAGDMNHWPGPRRVDRQMYATAGLTPVLIGEATFDVSRTRTPWLHKLGRIGLKINGELDAILYRGDMERHRTKLADIPSDHKAVMATFELE